MPRASGISTSLPSRKSSKSPHWRAHARMSCIRSRSARADPPCLFRSRHPHLRARLRGRSRENRRRDRPGIRSHADGPHGLPEHIDEIPLEDKFGTSWLGRPPIWLRKTRQAADRLGVTFHVGSQAMAPAAFGHALRSMSQHIVQAGVVADVIDVGGGFRPPIRSWRRRPSPTTWTKSGTPSSRPPPACIASFGPAGPCAGRGGKIGHRAGRGAQG